MQMGYEAKWIAKIVKEKTVTVASCKDDTGAGLDKPKGPRYKIGKKKVSKEKYNKYVKKMTKGSGKYEVKTYELTESNIQKYCQ